MACMRQTARRTHKRREAACHRIEPLGGRLGGGTRCTGSTSYIASASSRTSAQGAGQLAAGRGCWWRMPRTRRCVRSVAKRPTSYSSCRLGKAQDPPALAPPPSDSLPSRENGRRLGERPESPRRLHGIRYTARSCKRCLRMQSSPEAARGAHMARSRAVRGVVEAW